MQAVWRWVRAWTLRTLEKAGERVADVQGEDEEEEVEPQPMAPDSTQNASGTPQAESRKDQ